MRKVYQIVFFFFYFGAALSAQTQTAFQPCKNINIITRDQDSLNASLASSLWTFESNVWTGYIDFQIENKYWTHLGLGAWEAISATTIKLTNQKDQATVTITFDRDGRRFSGARSDGVPIEGRLLCGKYEKDPHVERSKLEEDIALVYRDIMGRELDEVGVDYWVRRIQGGTTLEEMVGISCISAEYLSRKAKGLTSERCRKISPRNHGMIAPKEIPYILPE